MRKARSISKQFGSENKLTVMKNARATSSDVYRQSNVEVYELSYNYKLKLVPES